MYRIKIKWHNINYAALPDRRGGGIVNGDHLAGKILLNRFINY